MKFRFTVELSSGKEASCYYNSDSFANAHIRSYGMVKMLLNKGCCIVKSSLREVVK
jgi:hypothetical protein